MSEARAGRVVSGCPFLQPTRRLGRGDVAIGVYCRLPDGRVRVPARHELRAWCIPGRFESCPTHERHASAAR